MTVKKTIYISVIVLIIFVTIYFATTSFAQTTSKPAAKSTDILTALSIVGLAIIQVLAEVAKKMGWTQTPTDKKVESLYEMHIKSSEDFLNLLRDWQKERIANKIVAAHNAVTDSAYKLKQEQAALMIDRMCTQILDIHRIITERVNSNYAAHCRCAVLYQSPVWDDVEKMLQRLIDNVSTDAINEVKVVALLESVLDKQRQVLDILRDCQ